MIPCPTCGKPYPRRGLAQHRQRAHGEYSQWSGAVRERARYQQAHPTAPAPAPVEDAPAPRLSSMDPCPVCGVAQARHWRCARCTSRGHQLGRGVERPELCAWCEAEVLGAMLGGALRTVALPPPPTPTAWASRATKRRTRAR